MRNKEWTTTRKTEGLYQRQPNSNLWRHSQATWSLLYSLQVRRWLEISGSRDIFSHTPSNTLASQLYNWQQKSKHSSVTPAEPGPRLGYGRGSLHQSCPLKPFWDTPGQQSGNCASGMVSQDCSLNYSFHIFSDPGIWGLYTSWNLILRKELFFCIGLC